MRNDFNSGKPKLQIPMKVRLMQFEFGRKITSEVTIFVGGTKISTVIVLVRVSPEHCSGQPNLQYILPVARQARDGFIGHT